MILRRQPPSPSLAPFVEFLWYYAEWNGDHAMEHLLPDGSFELVINLLDTTRKLFDREDFSRYTPFRQGWLSGAHARYLVIDTQPGASMIGVHFRPGGIAPFIPFSAAEFRNQVIPFENIWGTNATRWRERLLEASGPVAKLRLLDHFLCELQPGRRGQADLQKGVQWAARQFMQQPHLLRIRHVVEALGVSHRHFIDAFERQVGLTPKLFARIQRFQRILVEVKQGRGVAWSDLAVECGYYDQAHFIHDFRIFSGLNPSAYLQFGGDHGNFVPIRPR